MNVTKLSRLPPELLAQHMRDIEPGKSWFLFTPEETEEGCYKVFFTHEDFCISDPTVTECGRFQVDPTEEYGLTPHGAVTLLAINSILLERGNLRHGQQA